MTRSHRVLQCNRCLYPGQHRRAFTCELKPMELFVRLAQTGRCRYPRTSTASAETKCCKRPGVVGPDRSNQIRTIRLCRSFYAMCCLLQLFPVIGALGWPQNTGLLPSC